MQASLELCAPLDEFHELAGRPTSHELRERLQSRSFDSCHADAFYGRPAFADHGEAILKGRSTQTHSSFSVKDAGKARTGVAGRRSLTEEPGWVALPDVPCKDIMRERAIVLTRRAWPPLENSASRADSKRLRRKMAVWEWENLDYFFNSTTFLVSDSGPLRSPVRSFNIKRNEDGELILETASLGRWDDRSQLVAGTVRAAIESVAFQGQFRLPYNAVARSVIPFRHVTNTSRETDESETIETSSIRSIEGIFQQSGLVVLTIEWIENIHCSETIWTGASITTLETISTKRTIGTGESAIDLLETKTSRAGSNNGLRLIIDGTELYLCAIGSSKKGDNRQDRGFIAYQGDVADDKRRKIRHVLSFCLGTCLTSIGLITLDDASEAISMKAFSPNKIGREMARIPTLPPAPLWVSWRNEIHQDIVCKMANAIFARYDDLRFEELSWAYWHAACAPVHMAAAHYGAALEALRRACAESRSLRTTLVPDDQWRRLKERLLSSLSDAEAHDSALEVLKNKILGLNQLPQDKAMDEVLASMGLDVGTLERKAWQRRNKAAHGATFDRQQFTATIRETKLLRVLLHRMVLAETGASDRYYDYYSLGFPIRQLSQPIPAEAALPSVG